MMRKKITALFLVLSMTAGMFVGCASEQAEEKPTAPTKSELDMMIDQLKDRKQHFNNAALTAAECAEIKAARKETSADMPPALKINGVEAIYEQDSDSYFYTVAHDDVWEELKPSLDGYTAAYTTELKQNTKEDFISDGNTAEVMLYNDTEYMTVNVVFTSLPVMSFATQTLPSQYEYFDKDEDSAVEGYDPYAEPPADIDKPIGDNETFLEMRLLDADAKKHGYENGLTLMARAHIRGRSSRKYPKNSYKLELLKDENGVLVEKNETLLGMRNDGDWNLNGMYAEPTKVRDKVSADIWLAMTADREHEGFSTGYRCEYIELIINGHYHGLYLLTERIDHKQLGLQDGDLLYFSEGDIGKQYVDFMYVKDNQDMEVKGYSLKWPKERSEPYKEWIPFGEFTKLIQSTGSNTFIQTAGKMVNVDSLVDYEVFVQAVVGRDNIIQNTFYVARKQPDGSYKYDFLPWDLDQTFGLAWGGSMPLLTYEDYEGHVYWEGAFWVSSPFKRLNAEGFNERVNARYKELRETVLSDESMMEYVTKAHSQITDSGAFKRNRARWPEGGYSSTVGRLNGFIDDRMNYLDSYFN